MTGTFTVPASGTVDLVAQSVAFDYKDPADPSSGFTWPDANPVETFDTVCNKSTDQHPDGAGADRVHDLGAGRHREAAARHQAAGQRPAHRDRHARPPAARSPSPAPASSRPQPGDGRHLLGADVRGPVPDDRRRRAEPGDHPARLAHRHRTRSSPSASNPAGAQFVLEAPVTIAVASGGTTGDDRHRHERRHPAGDRPRRLDPGAHHRPDRAADRPGRRGALAPRAGPRDARRRPPPTRGLTPMGGRSTRHPSGLSRPWRNRDLTRPDESVGNP